MQDRVQSVIDDIRPVLQDHGGDIELVRIEKNRVFVRLKGACAGCPGAVQTMRLGVERRIKESVPEVEAVEAVE
jgi:Fe-S cluster biogenesis protein NfuA